MKLYIKTFGCQMNVHDSARIRDLLGQAGYKDAQSPAEADVIVINTCSVREKAWHKAISEVGRVCAPKNYRPTQVIVFAGCVAQQEGEVLFKRIPNLDIVVGPDRYRQLPDLIAEVRSDRHPRAAIGFDQGLPEDFLTIEQGCQTGAVSAFLTVMKGCVEHCAYCIVPTVRGPERCRRADDIIGEAETLVARGVQEIVLLGQKVNGYSFEETDFADLLGRLDRIEGLRRLRFTSPHPRHMGVKLIRAFGQLDSLCESIHLPVQSGSDRVLKQMGRRYSSGFYRRVASKLREIDPGFHISTDLIVGFPGETEADFEQTIALIEDVRFSGVFSFKYSSRPGTRASELEDDVPDAEKARRLAVVHEVVARIEREIREQLIGSRLEVLIEGSGRNPGQLTGRARNNQIVNFQAGNSAIITEHRGTLMDVDILHALPHCLEGKLPRENSV